MIGEKLVRAGIITEEQRDAALRRQRETREPFGDAMIRLGLLTEERLLRILSMEFNTKFIATERLRDLKVPEETISDFPLSLAEHHTVFPVLADRDTGKLSVVCGTGVEQQVVEMIGQLTGFESVQAYVGLASAVRALIRKHYHGDEDAFDSTAEAEQPDGEGAEEAGEDITSSQRFPVAPVRGESKPNIPSPTSGEPGEDAPAAEADKGEATKPEATKPEAAPVAKAAVARPETAGIDAILRDLVELGASDLHLSSSQPPLIRLDGEIRPLPGRRDPLSSDDIDRLVRPTASEHIQEQYDATYDADFAHEVPGVARFRMNWFRNIRGQAAVMRTIPTRVPTLNELGFPAVLKSLCDLAKGLVVVTGPTGSGKSTTLAAMVDYLNRTQSKHIITIEDPVEFVHENRSCLINQREVHTQTESFSRALRAALREDPDIVLVGEMRDLETVHIAIETAETGHLVFGTLHTTTAPSTVDRIIDQFPADQQAQIRVMLAESLRGVVAQTLCKRKTGGRVAAMEILVVNHAASNLIREGKTHQISSIMQTSKGTGMQTQIAALVELVEGGIITPEEAVSKAVDQVQMVQALENAGISGSVIHITR